MLGVFVPLYQVVALSERKQSVYVRCFLPLYQVVALSERKQPVYVYVQIMLQPVYVRCFLPLYQVVALSATTCKCFCTLSGCSII